MSRFVDQRDFKNQEILLAELYPKEYAYGSKASLYSVALKDEVINIAQYTKARTYYGKLWNYCGD